MKQKPEPNKPALASLRRMMMEHGLTYADVARLACVSPKTVEGWLATPDAASWRNFHPRHLQSIGFALPGFLKARKAKK